MRKDHSALHYPSVTWEKPVLNQFLEPGQLVTHPERADWGLGQVQSVIGDKVTVNFENVGKVVIDGSRVQLVLAE